MVHFLIEYGCACTRKHGWVGESHDCEIYKMKSDRLRERGEEEKERDSEPTALKWGVSTI